MSSNWNFRSILDVYPESDSFTCVSIKSGNLERCHNRRPLLSDMDLSEAASLLDIMDNCESLKTSFKYLEDLAQLTSCVIHSEAGDDQVKLITGQWKEKIMQHLKVEVDAPPVRPQSRRSIGRRRTLSTTVMTVLKEEKEEQSPPAKGSRASEMWAAAVARQNSNASTKSRPVRNMSRKITSLTSEVGFQDATNEQFPASMELPKEPMRAAPPTPTRRIPIRSKTHYPPAVGASDEWASYPLLSLLSRSSTLLKSDQQIENATAEIISERVLASRGRTNTVSSTGSSTTSGKTSGTEESDSGSSAPTSRSSSARASPTLQASKDNEMKLFPPLSLPPPAMIAPGPLSSSPKEDSLPTFDFGIYQSLPLPPGHKQSISNGSTPVSNKTMWAGNETGAVPPRSFEFDTSRPSFALKALEKPSSRRQSAATRPSDAEMGSILISSDDLVESSDEFRESPVLGTKLQALQQSESPNPDGQHLQLPTDEPCTLPEYDTVSMISTSWLNSPALSRASSVMSSRTPSRTSSLSLSRSSSDRKPARTSSFSLSRTLSRKLSRRSSTKSSPKIEEEHTSGTTISPKLPRRATSIKNTTLAKKEDAVPLNRLIQMSHELSRRLDGVHEPHGYAEVLPPTTTYKYRLPSSRPRSITPLPEMRFSKLFMGLESDGNFFPYVSAAFPFSIPRKQIADSERGVVDRRSKSVGNEERPRETDVFVRPAQVPIIPRQMPDRLMVPPQQVSVRRPQRQPPSVPKLTLMPPSSERLPIPPRSPKRLQQKQAGGVEMCAMCGNVQTIWGRCDCGTPVSARGTVGSRPVQVLPVRMERRPTKRVPKRGTTLRRIRRRVARAFTIS